MKGMGRINMAQSICQITKKGTSKPYQYEKYACNLPFHYVALLRK